MSPRQLERAVVLAISVTGMLLVIFIATFKQLMEHCQ
jgi:hypothetical protein